METALEYVLTNSYKAGMITYMERHPEAFDELIGLAISDKQPYSWRAAWLLWACMEKNDSRLFPYIKKIIATLPSKDDQQLRELLLILQRMELKENDAGVLFDMCVKVWGKKGKKASVRYNAFKLMAKIAKKYPGLYHEVMLLTQNHYMDSLSDTVKKVIYKMTDGLNPGGKE